MKIESPKEIEKTVELVDIDVSLRDGLKLSFTLWPSDILIMDENDPNSDIIIDFKKKSFEEKPADEGTIVETVVIRAQHIMSYAIRNREMTVRVPADQA